MKKFRILALAILVLMLGAGIAAQAERMPASCQGTKTLPVLNEIALSPDSKEAQIEIINCGEGWNDVYIQTGSWGYQTFYINPGRQVISNVSINSDKIDLAMFIGGITVVQSVKLTNIVTDGSLSYQRVPDGIGPWAWRPKTLGKENPDS